MNREVLGKVLSLSCVENYFLGYFQEKFDVRLLYAESFVPFQEVMNAFLNEGVSYGLRLCKMKTDLPVRTRKHNRRILK